MAYKSLRVGFITLLLVSCAPSGLPPEQVLEKAVVVAQQLRSADFSATLSVERGEDEQAVDLDIKGDGRLQDGGKQLTFAMDGSLAIGDMKEPLQSIGWEGEFLQSAEGQSYLRLTTLVSDPPLPMLGDDASQSLLDQWWVLPMPEAAASDVAPDPRLIELQARALVVTENRGMEIVRGKRAYRYAVTVDPVRMRAFIEEVSRRREQQEFEETLEALDSLRFSGNVAIDAKTFDILHLDWVVTSQEGSDPLRAEVALDLSRHNAADPITPPTGARPFPENLGELLPMTPQDAAPPAMNGGVPPEIREQIIRSMQQPR